MSVCGHQWSAIEDRERYGTLNSLVSLKLRVHYLLKLLLTSIIEALQTALDTSNIFCYTASVFFCGNDDSPGNDIVRLGTSKLELLRSPDEYTDLSSMSNTS